MWSGIVVACPSADRLHLGPAAAAHFLSHCTQELMRELTARTQPMRCGPRAAVARNSIIWYRLVAGGEFWSHAVHSIYWISARALARGVELRLCSPFVYGSNISSTRPGARNYSGAVLLKMVNSFFSGSKISYPAVAHKKGRNATAKHVLCGARERARVKKTCSRRRCCGDTHRNWQPNY
jgi:hypothetical protein